MTVTIGVIGCGKIADKHFGAYQKLDGVKIVASDIDETKRKKVERNGFEWRADPQGVIEADDIDAVDVCTPVHTHADLITDAFHSGKDVFCEKPLAKNADEARLIQQRAEESGNELMVGHLYRFHPAFEFANRILREGIIGDPYYAIFRVGGRGSASTWKHKADSGGGAINEMLVHMVDLVTWYFDEVDRIGQSYTDVILDSRDIDGETVRATAEDLAMLQLTTTDDVEVFCQSDLITPAYMNYIEIQGTNGSLWTTILDSMQSFVYCKEPRGIFDRGRNFREFEHVDLFERELDHFVDSVAGNAELEVNTAADAVEVHRILSKAFDGPRDADE